jgi:uncharacterized protein involved in response to NO
MGRSLLLGHGSPDEGASATTSLLAKGFRPFFLLAGLFAVGIVPLWLLILRGAATSPHYLDPITFHAHEMLYGFTVAVLAGFLLTAVGNWTQRETAVGWPLATLCGLWLAGRVAMLSASALPRGLTALVDLAFLPTLIAVLAVPLWAAKSRRNFIMLGVLTALWITNASTHFEALGLLPIGVARRAVATGVNLIALVMLIMAGRIFPMFTKNATGVTSIRSLPALDKATVVAMLLAIAIDAWSPAGTVSALLFVAAGVLAIARSVHWGARYSFGNPLLWVLHAGYAWLCFGLLLRAAANLGLVALSSLGTHALTVGAIGGLTLGMMARVALGHTGRMLAAPASMTLAFVTINLAAAARCFGPLAAPNRYMEALLLSGVLWAVAFAIFVATYAPILLRPRVDGRPG